MMNHPPGLNQESVQDRQRIMADVEALKSDLQNVKEDVAAMRSQVQQVDTSLHVIKELLSEGIQKGNEDVAAMRSQVQGVDTSLDVIKELLKGLMQPARSASGSNEAEFVNERGWHDVHHLSP